MSFVFESVTRTNCRDNVKSYSWQEIRDSGGADVD